MLLKSCIKDVFRKINSTFSFFKKKNKKPHDKFLNLFNQLWIKPSFYCDVN